jgi:hypothetical protein
LAVTGCIKRSFGGFMVMNNRTLFGSFIIVAQMNIMVNEQFDYFSRVYFKKTPNE